MKQSIRNIIIGLGVVTILSAAAIGAQAQMAAPVQKEKIKTINIKDVLVPHPLGEKVQGSATAPVTIVEYFSLTCSHCATFHKDTYPQLKAQYIDTGKVRFIHRDFWWDPIAQTESTLAWCSGDKYYAVQDMFFSQQDVIFKSSDRKATLKAIAQQMGINEKAYDECLANPKIKAGIVSVRDDAEKKLGVQSTPTFIINGEVHTGAMKMDEMAPILDRMIAAAGKK